MGMTPAQCRAARGYLDWSVKELERRSGVPSSCIFRFEDEIRKFKDNSVLLTFEKAGIIFLREGVLLIEKVSN